MGLRQLQPEQGKLLDEVSRRWLDGDDGPTGGGGGQHLCVNSGQCDVSFVGQMLMAFSTA